MSELKESRLKIWNPNAAGCWALLVTPICSSYLLYKNAQNLNNQEDMTKAKSWMIAGLLVWLLSVICAIYYPLNTGMINGFSLWYLILWYFLFVRKQVENLKQQFGESYSRYESFEWFAFLIIGFVIRLILIGLSVVIVSSFGS